MRLISDVIKYPTNVVSTDDIKKYFNLSDEVKITEELKLLYIFNMCGFYIPLVPTTTGVSLDKKVGWIELAKNDKKMEYHNNDGIKSQIGDIDVQSFHLITSDEEVKEFIRIPDRYLYTNIHVKTNTKKYGKINLTGEDIYMLNDANNKIERAQIEEGKQESICDYHEDGA